MATDEQPEVSLVLCTYGPKQPLHLLFESVRWQECKYELLTVDQKSDDRVPLLLKSYLSQTLLRSSPGLSRARASGSNKLLGVETSRDGKPVACRQVAVRKTTR